MTTPAEIYEALNTARDYIARCAPRESPHRAFVLKKLAKAISNTLDLQQIHKTIGYQESSIERLTQENAALEKALDKILTSVNAHTCVQSQTAKAFHLHVTPEELDLLIESLTSRCNRLQFAFKPANVQRRYDYEGLRQKLLRVRQNRITSRFQQRLWHTTDTAGKIIDPDLKKPNTND